MYYGANALYAGAMSTYLPCSVPSTTVNNLGMSITGTLDDFMNQIIEILMPSSFLQLADHCYKRDLLLIGFHPLQYTLFFKCDGENSNFVTGARIAVLL